MENTEQDWPSSPIQVMDFAARIALTLLGVGGITAVLFSLERVS